MALNITFFDNVKYKSTDFVARDADFFGAGVVNLTDFPITFDNPPSMNVYIGAGTAWVNGYRINNDSSSTITLTFATADPTNPRIDIIEVGYSATTDATNTTTGSPIIQIKQGVPSSTPIEPGADSGFVKLYAVNIAANQTSVSLSDVIDRRTRVPLNVDGSQIQNIPAVQPDYVNEIVADLFGSTSTVLSGGIPTANSSVHNQLDVTAADIYFADGQRVSFAASQNGQFVTTTASTTYYLDYNSDGTTSFGLSHSIKSGYVPIAQVETDSSGNIASVTNVRPTIVNMFGTTDNVVFGGNVQAQKFIGDGSQLTNLPIGNIVAGTGIEITANGNSDTITNTGVLSVNGQTGAVTVQGYSPLTNPMAWIG